MTRDDTEGRRQSDLEAGPLGAALSRALRDSRASLTFRWLERIEQRVTVEAGEVFPTEELLNHVPLLIDAIADFVADPAEEGPAADEVIGKAAELGEMRHRQGFSAHHVLHEFELLGGILLTFFRTQIPRLGLEVGAGEAFIAAHRLQRAISKIQQTTAARYLSLADEEQAAREERLRLVHDTLAGDLLPFLEAREGERGLSPQELQAVIEEVDQLIEVTRPRLAARRQRHVPLASVVREARRRVRSIAQSRLVELRVLEPLPAVEVHDALVELCLVVLLTNAIRYSARSSEERWVEIRGELNDGAGEVVVEVRDTGNPVPGTLEFRDLVNPAAGEPTVREDEPGVGLRFLERSIRGLGGRCWAEPATEPPGSVFAFTLPSRRTDDRPA